MAELKPCPFCGGHARVARESDADHMGNFYTVKCDKCCAETAPRFASYGCDDPQFYAEVRELWDRRSSEGAPPCRAQQIGPGSWSCDCFHMRPDCKPNLAAGVQGMDKEQSR